MDNNKSWQGCGESCWQKFKVVQHFRKQFGSSSKGLTFFGRQGGGACHVACGILVLPRGIEPGAIAVKAESLPLDCRGIPKKFHLWFNSSPLTYTSKRTENMRPYKNLYINIHYSQKMLTIQVTHKLMNG